MEIIAEITTLWISANALKRASLLSIGYIVEWIIFSLEQLLKLFTRLCEFEETAKLQFLVTRT